MSHYLTWGIIIDDIVFPDGRTAMGILGGGGLHAAVGMRLWTPDVAFVSAVGSDFQPETLQAYGLDPRHLIVTDLQTPRAWQLFEEDGRRTQIFRVPEESWHRQLVLPPTPRTIPVTAKAAHFLGRGDAREEEMIAALVEAGLRISMEPILDETLTATEKASLLRCMQHFEIFAPSTVELALLVGQDVLADQLRRLADLGPPLVTLRQGAAGSLVYERDADRFWRVPAAPAQVVDVTGAGNAYCGGFLVGWIETADVGRAAAMAAVSAALTIEQVGPAPVNAATLADARQRAAKLLEEIQPLQAHALEKKETNS